MRVLSIDAVCGAGKACGSTSVICVLRKAGRWSRACSVERPKTPLPRMRIDSGVDGGEEEDKEEEGIGFVCDFVRWSNGMQV